MNTKYVPSIIMLSAGAFYCVIGIKNHQPLLEFTIQLLVVLVIFLIIGSVIKVIFDVVFNKVTETDMEAEDFSTEGLEEVDADSIEEMESDEEDETDEFDEN